MFISRNVAPPFAQAERMYQLPRKSRAQRSTIPQWRGPPHGLQTCLDNCDQQTDSTNCNVRIFALRPSTRPTWYLADRTVPEAANVTVAAVPVVRSVAGTGEGLKPCPATSSFSCPHVRVETGKAYWGFRHGPFLPFASA